MNLPGNFLVYTNIYELINGAVTDGFISALDLAI